jgi:hypothetical protein
MLRSNKLRLCKGQQFNTSKAKVKNLSTTKILLIDTELFNILL